LTARIAAERLDLPSQTGGGRLQIFDRAVLVTELSDLKRFAEAPEDFLRSVGAMEGLNEFNGVEVLGAEDENVKSFVENLEDFKRGTIVHRGIPYQNHCSWVVII